MFLLVQKNHFCTFAEIFAGLTVLPIAFGSAGGIMGAAAIAVAAKTIFIIKQGRKPNNWVYCV